MQGEEPSVRARGLVVRYGPTRALAGVDLDVAPGRIHALVGENGAGKSTLLRVLAGCARLAAGEVRILGRSGPPSGPAEAERRGIGFATQEIEICPELRVAEQVTLGREPLRALGVVDRPAQRDRARALLDAVGADLDPDARVGDLGAVERKLLQLARALAGEPQLLLLDEPTAALDARGAAAVGRLLRRHADAGGTLLWVSHRIDEVTRLADSVSVLRDGRHVWSAAAPLEAAQIVRRMVGREIPPRRARDARPASVAPIRLEGTDEVPLRVRGGEIVGLAGLVGAGRSETLEAIARAHRKTAALVPEDRGRNGLVPTFGLRENVFLPACENWIRRARERARALEWVERLGIVAPGVDAPIQSLSGGNQQKLLLARALERRPEVFLLDEPTQGVDVGAKSEIHDRIRALAAAGAAVVLASSDLPELLQLADRIVVLRAGRAVGELDAAAAGEEQILALAAGVEAA